MLRTALNFSLEDHIHNVDLCGELPRISTKVQEGRMALAWSLCWPERTQGRRSRGRGKCSHVDVLKEDAGVENREELTTLMLNRTEWREVSRRFRDDGTPKN